MKHAWLKIALTGAAAITFVTALAGCSGGSGGGEYDHLVTFDYNFGTAVATTFPNQYIGVMDNSLVALYPTEDGKTGFESDERVEFALQQVQGYFFEGWYLPVLDKETGEPVTDEFDRVVCGEPWDFKNDRVNADLTLYAKFTRMSRLIIEGRTEDGEEVTLSNASVLETLYSKSPGTTITVSDTIAAAATGYTLMGPAYDPSLTGYYYDEEMTQPFSWPFTLGETDTTVYAKFLKGNWTFVRTAQEFDAALSANRSVYLMNDIDFTDTVWTRHSSYSGTINGNHHTVRNITCEWAANRTTAEFSLFGILGESFKVYDLTIEDVNVTFTAPVSLDPAYGSTIHVALFASAINEGASFENFSFTGSLSVTHPVTISVQVYGITHTDNSKLDLSEFFRIETEEFEIPVA